MGGQVLVVSVGPHTLAMDAGDVRAVAHGEASGSETGATPDTPETVTARRVLGVPGAVPARSRLLLVNTEPPRPLLVDAVHGLRELSALVVQRLPVLMHGNPRTPWLLGLGEQDGGLLLLVDARRLQGGGP